MGSTGAAGMADAINEGLVEEETALIWHLRSNHYPPLPMALVPLARWVINIANGAAAQGDAALIWETMVILPATEEAGQMTVNGKEQISVGDAIEFMHLNEFIDWSDL